LFGPWLPQIVALEVEVGQFVPEGENEQTEVLRLEVVVSEVDAGGLVLGGHVRLGLQQRVQASGPDQSMHTVRGHVRAEEASCRGGELHLLAFVELESVAVGQTIGDFVFVINSGQVFLVQEKVYFRFIVV